MSSLNKVQIIGRLGRDPESRSFQNGGKVVNLRVATSERWTDRQSGEQKERTEWHSVAIHNEGLCGIAERYMRKGSQVYVEGQLRTRKWQDQGGNDRYATEIVLTGYDAKIVLLDGKPQDGGGQRSDQGGGSAGGGSAGGGSYPDLDDDVPF